MGGRGRPAGPLGEKLSLSAGRLVERKGGGSVRTKRLVCGRGKGERVSRPRENRTTPSWREFWHPTCSTGTGEENAREKGDTKR